MLENEASVNLSWTSILIIFLVSQHESKNAQTIGDFCLHILRYCRLKSGDFESRDEFVATAVSMYRHLEEHEVLRVEIQRRVENARNGSVADRKSVV